jgi:hypothetical protein
METQEFADKIVFANGYMPDLPLDASERFDAIGDGENVTLDEYGRVSGWPGLSRRHGVAGKLMFVADDKFASIDAGSLIVGPGKSLWSVGSGAIRWDNPATNIGNASSLLQVLTKDGQLFQAGLPAPPKPSLVQATDSAGANVVGQMTGSYQASLTRIRTATGAESAESEASALLDLSNGKARLFFSRALTEVGQDKWGVYFTQSGFDGIRYRLRNVDESELATDNTGIVGDATGTGVATTFGVTSASAVDARLAGVALAPAGGTAPLLRGARSYATQRATSLTSPFPEGVLSGDFLMVGLLVKQVHQVSGNFTNVGIAEFAINGAWSDGGFLAPGAEQIEIEILSTTTYRFKRTSELGWTGPVAMTTTPAAFGVSGLSIKWNAAYVDASQVGNYYYVAPFALTPPSGFTFQALRASNRDEYALCLFTHNISSAGSATWTFSTAISVKADFIAYSGVHATPLAATAFAETIGATTHNVVFGGAPTATQKVVVFVAGVSETTFTATSPLTLQIQPGTAQRYLDFDFNDGDLQSVVAPSSDLEPPPAATHIVQMGAVLALLGTEDGTGITPSQPGQWEQYPVIKTTFLNPAEQVLRVDVRAIDGQPFIWTANSVQTLILTADEDEPILPRQIQGARGIANANAAAVGDNVAYSFKRGQAYRILNGVETAFADPMAKIFRTWNDADVVVGYDPRQRIAAYCYGRDIYAYHEDLNEWTTRQDASAFVDWTAEQATTVKVQSTATKQGSLFLSIGNATLGYRLFEYKVGLGTNWRVRSNARSGGFPGLLKTIGKYQMTANLEVQQEIPFYYLSSVESFLEDFFGGAVNSYALSNLVLDRLTVTGGEYELEWIVRASGGGSYILADHANLSPYGGAGALLHSSVNALLAVRINAASVQCYKASVATGSAVPVLPDDVLRLRCDGAGVWTLTASRSASTLATITLGAITANTLGLKVIADNGLRMNSGIVRRVNTSAIVRFYRNFVASILKPKTFPARGDSHYQWEQVNIRRNATYKIEIEGSGAGQSVSHFLLGGEVEPLERL